MSEWIVVLAACLTALTVAVTLARRVALPAVGGHEFGRLLGAVQRAASEFLWLENRQLFVLLGIVGIALVAPALIDSSRFPSGFPAANATGLLAGAIAAGIVALICRRLAANAVGGTLLALGTRSAAVESTAFHGAAASSLVSDATSLLVTVLAFGGHYLYLTHGAADPTIDAPLLASRMLPSVALGAVCAAAVYQVGGSSFHTATGVTAAALQERHTHIRRDEEQNPVLVAELVGDSVGATVSRCTDAFAAMTFANCALSVVACTIARDNATDGSMALGIATLPLTIRGAGLLAASIGTAALRLDGELSPRVALAGATASAAIVQLTALFGLSYWLVGDPHFLGLLGAGALGVVAPLLSVAWLLWSARRTAFPGPHPGELPRPETSVARALGLGLQQTWPPLAIVSVCLAGAWMCGASLPVSHGGTLALIAAVAALLGSGALSLGQTLLAPISQSVRRISGLRRGGLDEEAQRRARQLERLAETTSRLGQTQIILAAAATALLAAITLPLSTLPAAAGTGTDFAHPVVLLGGLLGAGSLSFFVGSVLKTSTKTANLLGREFQEDVQPGFEPVAPRAPRTATYLPSVRLATEGATASILPLSLLAVGTPIAVGMLLEFTYGQSDRTAAALGLMSYAIFAALTGCFAALAAQGALTALCSTESVTTLPTQSATQFIERSVGPAALLALKATVAASIAATSFVIV